MDHTRANYNSLWGSARTCCDDGYKGYDTRYHKGTPPFTSPVGSFPANGYGLYDMAGNVWEWSNDKTEAFQNIRGGSWNYFSCYHRTGYKYETGQTMPDDDLGFRTVCR